MSTVVDQLPKVIEKFSAIEEQTKKVVTDVGEVTGRVKESPIMKIFPAKEKTTSEPAEKAAIPPKEKRSRSDK